MTAPAHVGPSPSGGGPAVSHASKPATKLPLTPHQIDVLQRIAKGHPWERIGRDLGITAKGVGSVGKEILRKLGAVSSANAVMLACEAGILDGRRRGHGALPESWVQVLELVAAGCTNEEIAVTLGRSKNTVIDQVAAARRRLGARDRAHAAALAVALQLVQVDLPPEIRAESHAA